jgi:predicted glycosyltransferase
VKEVKIWVDINTPKQALFFMPVIRALEKDLDEVFVTTRVYPQATQMLELLNIQAEVIGEHGGADLKSKLIADSKRIIDLTERVTNFNPDVLLSFVSPTAARVAFGLKIPHVTCSDSPHSFWVSKLVLPIVDFLVTSEYIPLKEWTRYGITADRIIRYKALDQATWVRGFMPDPSVPEKLGVPQDFKGHIVTVRIEEAQASYLLGKASEKVPSLLPLIDHLANKHPDVEVFVLPRYPEQASILKDLHKDSKNIHVITEVVDATSLIAQSSLFVGAGGTMNAEAVLLGTPAIMTFEDPLVVYNWLVEEKHLLWIRESKTLLDTVDRILKNPDKEKSAAQARAKNILASMDDPTNSILTTIKRLANP